MTNPIDAYVAQERERLIKGASDYAAFDRSDPFTFGRCMAHINAGICDKTEVYNDNGELTEVRDPSYGAKFVGHTGDFLNNGYRDAHRP